MTNNWFTVHDGLAAAARVRPLSRARHRLSAAEVFLLLASGAAAAAAVGFAKLGLSIPGHSIVLAALPMAFGLAIAPRRLAGSLMSAGAFGSGWLFTLAGGASYGSGSFVSLCLLGPMMDVALRRVGRGWRVYAALVMAGALTNALALGSRAAAKLLGFDPGGRPFDSWWVQAMITYTLSGVVAGLLGALCWFHLRDRRDGDSEPA
jgi:hypothetical protein